jgi:hypothetical protein
MTDCKLFSFGLVEGSFIVCSVWLLLDCCMTACPYPVATKMCINTAVQAAIRSVSESPTHAHNTQDRLEAFDKRLDSFQGQVSSVVHHVVGCCTDKHVIPSGIGIVLPYHGQELHHDLVKLSNRHNSDS